MTPSVVTPRGGLRLFVGRCILCRGRRSRSSVFSVSYSGNIYFGGQTQVVFVFVFDRLYRTRCSLWKQHRWWLSTSLSWAFSCWMFSVFGAFKGKRLLKSYRAEEKKGPLTLGGTWRGMATNTSAQTEPLRASRWTTAESWGTLSLCVRAPHPENTNTLSDRPRTATGTKPLPRDTVPHASKLV